LWFSTHLLDYVLVYHVSFGRYRSLKLPLSCEVLENVFLFIEEGIPQISDMRFQITLTYERVAGFG